MSINKVLEAVSLISDQKQKDGKLKGTIKCPECGGELHYSIASSNGHIWGACENKECLKWIS